MTLPELFWRPALVVGALLVGLQTAWPQTSPALNFAPPTNTIPPTVTDTMGEVGGKFFGRIPEAAKTRRYYIAAEPQLWDYAPLGQDPICGKPFPPTFAGRRRGGKIRYIQYTDESFQAKIIETPRLGLLGPVLRGVVGDYLAVTFLNRTSRPLSMHPHGVKYDKDSEGSYYQPQPGLGAAVGPGAKFTYVWQLDADSGPLASEPSSKGWLYHSHVEGDEEADLGLVGFIVVTDPKRARADSTPNDIDREMAALFMTHDESGIGAALKEALEYGTAGVNMPQLTWTQIQEQTEQGARPAINGFIYGNAPGLEMNQGERVRWYLFGLGSEGDFHTAHWHGVRVLDQNQRRTDVIELLPASMKVADMVADNPGTWLFHCHVAAHMLEGMFARIIVHPSGSTKLSRDPEQAFFGLPKARQSLQLKRVGATLRPDAAGAPSVEMKIEGTVTVFDAFSVFTQPVQLQLGEKSAAFKPDRRGGAKTAEGTFQVKNASAYGVVYGGMMEFEAVLTGPGWLAELKKLGLNEANPAASAPAATLTVQVGAARHSGTARVAFQ
jgi:FtsP/CotA-like multicopper oxidase with cupredoxin domain